MEWNPLAIALAVIVSLLAVHGATAGLLLLLALRPGLRPSCLSVMQGLGLSLPILVALYALPWGLVFVYCAIFYPGPWGEGLEAVLESVKVGYGPLVAAGYSGLPILDRLDDMVAEGAVLMFVVGCSQLLWLPPVRRSLAGAGALAMVATLPMWYFFGEDLVAWRASSFLSTLFQVVLTPLVLVLGAGIVLVAAWGRRPERREACGSIVSALRKPFCLLSAIVVAPWFLVWAGSWLFWRRAPHYDLRDIMERTAGLHTEASFLLADWPVDMERRLPWWSDDWAMILLVTAFSQLLWHPVVRRSMTATGALAAVSTAPLWLVLWSYAS